jgi:hypothetical protein
MDRTRLKKILAASGGMAAVTFANFSRLSGLENIRPIHQVSLLVCGIMLGIFIFAMVMLMKEKNK